MSWPQKAISTQGAGAEREWPCPLDTCAALDMCLEGVALPSRHMSRAAHTHTVTGIHATLVSSCPQHLVIALHN